MALTVKIEPIQIIDKRGVTISAIVSNYDLNGQNCQLYWWLSDDLGNNIYNGNYNVPPDTLSVWGSDDMVIMSSLATSMGFVIVPPSETVSSETVSSETVSPETVSSETVSSETVSSETVSSEPITDQ